MKKYLTIMALAAILPLVISSCSADDDSTPAAPALSTPANKANALKLNISAPESPYSFVEFTESGRAILKKNTPAAAATRADLGTSVATENAEYIFASYTLDNGIYEVTGNGGPLFTLALNNQSGPSVNITITPQGAEPINVAAVVETATTAASSTTSTLCRTWVVESCRLRHKGAVTAVKRFDDGCNLNEILDYAKTKATFNETLEENYVVKDITFTTSGSFVITYENSRIDLGEWHWANEQTGTISYAWKGEEMGNRFESGECTFDVRNGKYTLTLKATIDDDKAKGEYDIELSLYLQEA